MSLILKQTKNLIKSLIKGKKRTGGRNMHGHITTFHRGGGHKKKLRLVNFKPNYKFEGPVIRTEYDPNRSAFLALIFDIQTKTFLYRLAPLGTKTGMFFSSQTQHTTTRLGHQLNLKSIPSGTLIHNLNLYPGHLCKIGRTAGTNMQLLYKNQMGSFVRLNSGEERLVSDYCTATIGSIGNITHKDKIIGSAGCSRWLGRRPIVRGIAMNPVDHPHGGRTNGGRPSSTPWGLPTKGRKTRNPRKHSIKFIKKP